MSIFHGEENRTSCCSFAEAICRLEMFTVSRSCISSYPLQDHTIKIGHTDNKKVAWVWVPCRPYKCCPAKVNSHIFPVGPKSTCSSKTAATLNSNVSFQCSCAKKTDRLLSAELDPPHHCLWILKLHSLSNWDHQSGARSMMKVYPVPCGTFVDSILRGHCGGFAWATITAHQCMWQRIVVESNQE